MARAVHREAQQSITATDKASAPRTFRVCVLLPGEAGPGEVLGRGGGAHRNGRIPAVETPAKTPKGGAEFCFDLGGHGAGRELGADPLRGVRVVLWRCIRRHSCQFPDAGPEVIGLNKMRIGRGGQHKPRGDRQPGLDEAAQPHGLAAGHGDVACSHIRQAVA